MTTTYFWKGKPNFGDLLGPLLMKHFGNLDLTWAPIAEADLITVGSNLHLLPDDWHGVVAGAGKLSDVRDIRLPHARIFGVRGPLTAKGLGRSDLTLGDPGLLADELVRVERKEHQLGIVPHWSDRALERRPDLLKWKPLIIRPEGDPLDVIRAIGSCRKIVASSLHGIIVADAFSIPRRIEMCPQFTREGGDFKFRDHCAALSMPFEVGVTQEAPRYMVQDRQFAIFDMLRAVGAHLRNQRTG